MRNCETVSFRIFSFKFCTFSSSFVPFIRVSYLLFKLCTSFRVQYFFIPLLTPTSTPSSYLLSSSSHTHQSPHTLTTHTHHTLITHTNHTLTTHTHHTHSPYTLITHMNMGTQEGGRDRQSIKLNVNISFYAKHNTVSIKNKALRIMHRKNKALRIMHRKNKAQQK